MATETPRRRLVLPPMPPTTDDWNLDTIELSAYDQFASWPIPEQVEGIDGLTLADTRELLERLDELAELHRTRAGMLLATAEVVRDRLNHSSTWNQAVAVKAPVGMHTMQVIPGA